MKKILSAVAAAALAASMVMPAWAAVASPFGGAETETPDVTYTTQGQTGETSQATEVFETIQDAETPQEGLEALEPGLTAGVQAQLGAADLNEYRARAIGEGSIPTQAAPTVTPRNPSRVTPATEGFVMYLGADGLWHYLPVSFGDRSATFTLPYSTTIILYVRVAVAQ